MTEPTAQEAAQDEADGIKEVTFTWDGEEFTVPAYDELTADQLTAVEDYVDRPISVRHAQTLIREVLTYEQARRSFDWTGSTKAEDILMETAEFFKVMAEDGWGLGKASNRRERRSGRTTKR